MTTSYDIAPCFPFVRRINIVYTRCFCHSRDSNGKVVIREVVIRISSSYLLKRDH